MGVIGNVAADLSLSGTAIHKNHLNFWMVVPNVRLVVFVLRVFGVVERTTKRGLYNFEAGFDIFHVQLQR